MHRGGKDEGYVQRLVVEWLGVKPPLSITEPSSWSIQIQWHGPLDQDLSQDVCGFGGNLAPVNERPLHFP